MSAGNPTKKPFNYARQMIWVFAVQMLLLIALLIGSEFIPTWVNRLIIGLAISLPVLVYLPVLRKPEMRGLWFNFIRDCCVFFGVVIRFIVRLFNPVVVFRAVCSLKRFPESTDEWVTLCTLPFKTYIVAAYPVTWAMLKLTAQLYPRRWISSEMISMVLAGYLASLVMLLIGYFTQKFFCRPGRATNTLRFIIYGFGFLLLWAVILTPSAL